MVNVVKILNHLTFMLISKPKLTCLPVRLQQRTPKFHFRFTIYTLITPFNIQYNLWTRVRDTHIVLRNLPIFLFCSNSLDFILAIILKIFPYLIIPKIILHQVESRPDKKTRIVFL